MIKLFSAAITIAADKFNWGVNWGVNRSVNRGVNRGVI